jgi:hypothetical protein
MAENPKIVTVITIAVLSVIAIPICKFADWNATRRRKKNPNMIRVRIIRK